MKLDLEEGRRLLARMKTGRTHSIHAWRWRKWSIENAQALLEQHDRVESGARMVAAQRDRALLSWIKERVLLEDAAFWIVSVLQEARGVRGYLAPAWVYQLTNWSKT